jgi:hypothetical protein
MGTGPNGGDAPSPPPSPAPSPPASSNESSHDVATIDSWDSNRAKAFKTLFPYILTSLTFVIVTVFSAIFMMTNKINDLRTWLALALTATFIVLCMGTFSLIIANGNRTMTFDKTFLQYLGGVTIAEVAGIVVIVFNFFFKAASQSGTILPK